MTADASDDAPVDFAVGGSDEPGTPAADFLEMLGPLRVAWESSPALVSVVAGPDHRLIYQNAASLRHFGVRDLGIPLMDAFPELPDRSTSVLDAVLATGEPVSMQRRNIGLRNPDGDEILLHYVVAPLGSAAPYDGLVMTSVDVTAQVKAESAAERAELLSRISQQMSTAHDPEAALAVLTRELVPALADVAAVFITPPGAPDRDQGGNPPAAITISDVLLADAGPPPPSDRRSDPTPWDGALAAGRLVLISPDEVADRGGRGSPTSEWLTATRTRNIAVVPLTVAGDLSWRCRAARRRRPRALSRLRRAVPRRRGCAGVRRCRPAPHDGRPAGARPPAAEVAAPGGAAGAPGSHRRRALRRGQCRRRGRRRLVGRAPPRRGPGRDRRR